MPPTQDVALPPVEGLKYYLHPNACFLAIKAKLTKQKEEILAPIHIVYKAKEVRVPLKFFANAGTFELYLYVLKDREPLGGTFNFSGQREAVHLKKFGIHYNSFELADSVFLSELKVNGLQEKKTTILRYLGKRVNDKKNPIRKWDQDPMLDL